MNTSSVLAGTDCWGHVEYCCIFIPVILALAVLSSLPYLFLLRVLALPILAVSVLAVLADYRPQSLCYAVNCFWCFGRWNQGPLGLKGGLPPEPSAALQIYTAIITGLCAVIQYVSTCIVRIYGTS